MNRKNRRQRQTIFLTQYKIVHKKIEKTANQQNRKELNRVKQLYNVQQDDCQNLINLLIDIERIYRKEKKYEKAKSILNQCIQKIKSQFKNCAAGTVDFVVKTGCQIAVNSEFGFIFAEQAEQFSMTERQKFIQLINKSIDRYQQSIHSIAKTIYENQKILTDPNQKNWMQQWLQSYAKALVSLIDPLVVEAQQIPELQNQAIFKMIIKLCEKIESFCNLVDKTIVIRQLISKSYYYRGSIMHKVSRNYKQIQQYLQKDYKFCLENQLKEDAEKSRVELQNFYKKRRNDKETRKLLTNQHQKQEYNKYMVPHYKQVKQLQQSITSRQFEQQSKQKQKDLIEQYYFLISNSCWYESFIQNMRPVSNRIQDNQILAIIYYKMASCYLDTFDQVNALSFCNLSLKNCRNNLELQYNCLFLIMQVHQIKGDKPKMIEAEKMLRASKYKAYDEELNNHIKCREFKQQRTKYIQQKIKDSEIEKQIFTKLSQSKVQKTKLTQQKQDCQQKQVEFGPKASFMRKPTSLQKLKQNYVTLCKQNNIAIRSHVLQQIKKLPQDEKYLRLDLSLFFQISTKQLQIYLQVNRSETWDLRNFKITNNLLNLFNKNDQISSIKTLKLCDINKFISLETFSQAMAKLQSIQELHLQKLPAKFIEKDLPFLKVTNPLNLKILKLKNCRLCDDSLAIIVSQYQLLTQLDLAINDITGATIKDLNKLAQLQKLNLSYNPLQTLSQLKNQRLKKLKLKNIRRKQLNEDFQIPQISYCQIVDLSENTESILQSLLAKIDSEATTSQNLLPNLKELRLKKCNISQAVLRRLNKILVLANSIQQLDIRFCHYQEIRVSYFEANQKKCKKILKIDSRAHLSQEYKQNS